MINLRVPLLDHHKIIIICGPMFSGKTTLLIKLAHEIGDAALVVKSSLDTRYDSNKLATHNQIVHEAIPFSSCDEILRQIHSEYKVILVDEGHFFGESIIDTCLTIRSWGKIVVLTIVDHDHLGRDYWHDGYTRLAGNNKRSFLDLQEVSDVVIRLTASCSVCGSVAHRFKRVINGKIGPDDPYIWVAGSDVYKPLCLKHFDEICNTGLLQFPDDN